MLDWDQKFHHFLCILLQQYKWGFSKFIDTLITLKLCTLWTHSIGYTFSYKFYLCSKIHLIIQSNNWWFAIQTGEKKSSSTEKIILELNNNVLKKPIFYYQEDKPYNDFRKSVCMVDHVHYINLILHPNKYLISVISVTDMTIYCVR